MSGNGSATYKLLVVEDDPIFLEDEKMQLEAAGFEVVAADGQNSAREVLKSGAKFDLAVLDLMMEEPDGGFILAYEIKKKDPNMPIIIVTAVSGKFGINFDPTDEEERSWVKADAVLAKPVRMEQLRAEITRLLAKA